MDLSKSTSYIPNESLPLKNLVTILEKNSKNTQYNISILCETKNVKRRSLYDFIVVASAFNACCRKSNNEFEWKGLHFFKETIPLLAKHFETEFRYHSIQVLFDCSNQPTLAKLALSLIKLFVYLNENIIDIRQAAKLFAQQGAKYKTMLRKLYTVISCFEVADVVSRTNSSAEIRLLIPFTQPNSVYSIQSLIQNKDTNSSTNMNVYDSRRSQYKALVGSPAVFTLAHTVLPPLQHQTVFPPLTSIAPNASRFPSILQMTTPIDQTNIQSFLHV